jgi:hypothetical protein
MQHHLDRSEGANVSYVFLSHRSIDKPRIRPFVCRLAERGIPFWVDRPEEFNLNLAAGERPLSRTELSGGIPPGSDWPLRVDDALMRARAIIVFWSVNWTSDRAVLVREHGAAHMFHNVGYSTYIPVMLDDPSRMNAAVLDYRQHVHDVVQAYDIARFGNVHWDGLIHQLEGIFTRRDQFALPQAAPAASIAARRTDWGLAITATLDPEKIAELLMHIPPGPAVPQHIIPHQVFNAFPSSISDIDASLLLSEAAGAVLKTFPPELRRRPETLVVMPYTVPNAIRVPAESYWQSVFANACVMGPRMVAALLLCVRASVLMGLEDQVVTVLQELEAHK